MFKLLIVDDDEMERRGIRSLSLLEALDIEVVGEAWNGREGLELCETLRPDIVLTDVRMPVMDGLGFSQELMRRHPDTRVLMMSGYEDFDAVRLAVSVGAWAYLTKPLALDDLKSALERVTGALRGEQHREEEGKQLQIRLEQMMPLMRERLLRDVLLGVRGADDAQTCSEAQSLCGYLVNAPLCVMILQLQLQNLPPEQQLGGNTRAFDVLGPLCIAMDAQLFSIRSGLYALIFTLSPSLDDEALFDSLQAHATRVLNELQQALSCELTVAVSGVGKGIWSLHSLHQQALSTLQKQALYSSNRVYWYEQNGGGALLPDAAGILKQLEERMFSHDMEGLKQALNAFFSGLREVNATIEYARILCVDLIFRHSLLAHADGKDFLSLFEGREIPYARVMSTRTADELQAFLLDVYAQALDRLYVRPASQAEALVHKVRKLIAADFDKPISAATIAKEVFLTESHLRRVFKNVTGQTIGEHILMTRMQRACELLRGTDMRVFEIAGAVGYENHSYFSIVFRKYFGKAPGEYRDEFS